MIELEMIKSLIGANNFIHISDPMLGVTSGQIDIIRKLIGNNKLFFSCDIKANYVKEDLINLMSGAGIIVFSLGIESLNNRALQLVNKNCSAENELRAATIIKGCGRTFVKSYWIIGLPGEDNVSLQYNIDQMYRLLNDNIVDEICNHILVPYPGTDFFNFPKKYDIKINHHNWLRYEGRSYLPVYSLKHLSSKNIYQYFLKSQESELKYYQETYTELSKSLNKINNNENITFAKFKGRLL